MRKLICFFLALMLCLPLAAGAQGVSGSGSPCGDSLTWTLSGNLLFISGEGEMYDYPNGAPWAAYKDTITTVILSGNVTAVGGYAFKDYDSITSVDFGTALMRIGPEAFSSCDGLTSITLPSTFKKFGSNSFRSCGNLGQIYLNGFCPRFDEGCMWDTYCTIYYPANNPWDSGTITQLESAFHNRISFRPSDVSPSMAPAEVVIIPETTVPTLPVYIPETTTPTVFIPETVPTPQAPSDDPIVFTRPEAETMPVTVPTAPEVTEIPTVPTVPAFSEEPATAATEPETAPEFLFTQPTRPTQPAAERRATDGSSIYAVLIIAITLSIIGIGALIFRLSHSSRNSRSRKKRSRR